MRGYVAEVAPTGGGAALAGAPVRLAANRPIPVPNAKSPIKQGVARIRVFRATPRLPATPLRLRLMEPEIGPLRAITGRQTMTETPNSTRSASGGLLGGWISRLDLALELGLTVETLRRWEARRTGPPCVRAGRKVYYRRTAVQDWLQGQEAPGPRKAGGRR